ncbi:hypothetical protein [Halobellus sp. H-GB7]|uniref:hypothetical protein n=1 Tax=Halobellus sp. H-GB7 TaxID=3069756 RepID=UPI0027B850F0|nr:hypothetical protein [Halobellus sp. H-GB7]MDQ2054299.1 hypothetical protein [Halobellus sp. H-GB7]
MTPLDFAAKRDSGSASWKRADPEAALIERLSWDTWLVTLPDSDDVHEVSLHRDHGALSGECKVRETGEQCPARKYRDADEPCAHLCTIRKALVLNDKADDGTTIEVFDRDDVEVAAADAHVEDAMADGGREVSR